MSDPAPNPSTPVTAAATAEGGPAEAAMRWDLSEVVARHEGRLLRYVAQVLGAAAEAEDVVQEAFLRLHRHAARHGRESVRDVSSWLARAAHNLAIDALRRRESLRDARRRAAEDAPGPSEGEATGLGDLERREACDRAMAELDKLPAHQRDLVMLKIVQGLSLRQISETTGLSVGNAGYRINQALRELSRRLKEQGVI